MDYAVTKTSIHNDNNCRDDTICDPTAPKHKTKPMSKVPTSNFQPPTSSTAITLVALVVTIIVLLVLAGVTLNAIIGKGGIINKAQTAKEETQKSTATEIIKSKILACQMNKYSEKQELPSIQILGEELGKDKEISYVSSESKKIVSEITFKSKQKASIRENAISKCEIEDWTGVSTIYTKLKDYPYEFEINKNLQLAKIDGIEIADTSGNKNEDNSSYVTKQQYDELLKEVSELKEKVSSLETNVNNTLKVTTYRVHDTTFGDIELEPGDYKCIISSFSFGAMTVLPSEYYVSIGNHPKRMRCTYYKSSNEGTMDWNVNVGSTSNGKGYVNFTAPGQDNYQLTIIKIDKGHD